LIKKSFANNKNCSRVCYYKCEFVFIFTFVNLLYSFSFIFFLFFFKLNLIIKWILIKKNIYTVYNHNIIIISRLFFLYIYIYFFLLFLKVIQNLFMNKGQIQNKVRKITKKKEKISSRILEIYWSTTTNICFNFGKLYILKYLNIYSLYIVLMVIVKLFFFLILLCRNFKSKGRGLIYKVFVRLALPKYIYSKSKQFSKKLYNLIFLMLHVLLIHENNK
jgi:hypothetical protein